MANSAEAIVSAALRGLVANRCYPDIAPELSLRPYITYQVVGGQDVNALGGAANLENARVQVNVWADTRAEAVSLMRSVVTALIGDAIRAVPIGGPVSIHESDTKLYGSRKDFSIWFYP